MTDTPSTKQEMPKAYAPGEVEKGWYSFWMEKGYFTPQIDPQKKPFVIIMPPPNVTGELHIGHALTATLEDIMTRWHRMLGEPSLWLPGFDHAGIATQVVMERRLTEEGMSRHDLGRGEFERMLHEWADICHRTIVEQHKALGTSCDWSRERFTLDEDPSHAVRTTFVNLYKKGLIYRGERITNWCPRCGTAISDLEVEHKEVNAHLYYIRYPLTDSDGEYITVATTRPETMLGDTAVAVNPDDERFKGMIGKKLSLPLTDRHIEVVADEAIDPEFGTGAVKVTPSHDPVDFEVALRRGLPLVNILNPDATMNQNAGRYQGMDRYECRKAVLADLEKDGLLAKTEDYVHSVGYCQRCRTVIEPSASQQWFVNTEPLAKPAIEAVKKGQIKIIPTHFTKTYLNWMENLRHWCISRQLWWGHRIPVWYCQGCGEVIVAIEDPTSCPKCGASDIEQDPDVLDTWFSSALWPHSTLGWPDKTADLDYFYPTSVMETGYDIIFFWVARMIMMGIENTGQIPFHTVYLHGMVRDEKGEKMSKVRGNVINPLETLEKYGTDALRFALSTGTAPGNDIKLTPVKLEAGRNFANKLWNAARFVMRSLPTPEDFSPAVAPQESLPTEDRWILSRLDETIKTANALLEDHQFGEAQRQIHDFLWGDYCDWYIEIVKTRLHSTDKATESPLPVLVFVLETALRLLHPFMPFLTEELWQRLKAYLPQGQTESIMIAPYPHPEGREDPQAERTMEAVIDIVRSIRNVRAEHKVDKSKWVEARVYGGDLKAEIAPYAEAIEALARTKPLSLVEGRRKGGDGKNALALVLNEADVEIPMESMVDVQAERERLEKEIANLKSATAGLESRLKNKAFLDKAPAKVVESERAKLKERQDRLERLKQQLGEYRN